MWFAYSLITTLVWGVADLFYKKGNNETEKYSHLKTSMAVGLVMGAHAVITLVASEVSYNPLNLLRYLPVSAMYILSMTIGYFGLRYLELSISSPIQNSSGAVVCILCLIFLKQKMSGISAIAVVLICFGIIFLGVFESRKDRIEDEDNNSKYKMGLVAFFMPVLYCIIDSLGTFFDAFYLDDANNTPLLDVTEENIETVANTSYELTFFICAVIIFVYLKCVKNEKLNILHQKNRVAAAVFETVGQGTYVYAMSGMAVVAAPMVASYSIISLVLSRIFLKEKLSKSQYISISLVVLGIIALGISECLEI